MAKKQKIVDALSPLDAVVSALAFILIGLLCVGAVGAIFGEFTVFNMDSESICATSRTVLGGDLEGLELKSAQEALGIQDGVRAFSSTTDFCQDDPGADQIALVGLGTAPTFVVFVGFLLLTQRTIRSARRDGLFTLRLAARIERLGWLLLLGLVMAAIAEWLADGLLLHSMLPSSSRLSGSFSISIAGIVGAYGIISVGRVMARAADLSTELEGTV